MEQPRLRFNVFEDEWKNKKIKEISKDVIGGGTPNTKIAKYWDGKIPWIRSSDLTEDNLTKVKIEKHVNDLAIKNTATKLIPKDSIAVVVRVGVGKLAYMDTNYATSQDFLSFSSLKGNPYYLIYCLKLAIDKEKVNLQGTAIKGITKGYLLSRKVDVSQSLQEQTKIGHYFQLLDRMIGLQQAKLNHLRKLKNGYLQKMFTSEDIPKLRFNGFENKWKNEKLISILSDSNGIKRGPFGSSLKKSDFIKKNNYVVYEQRNAIYNQFHTRYNISQKKYNDLNQFHLSYGDFIMSGSGTIGKISRVPQKIRKGVFNQALIRIKINEHVNSSYFLQFMRSNLMQRKIKANNPGSAMQNLRPIKEIKNISITIPLLSEQKQIGHFFNLLDKQIELANRKLLSLQKTKKAYLQKMFI